MDDPEGSTWTEDSPSSKTDREVIQESTLQKTMMIIFIVALTLVSTSILIVLILLSTSQVFTAASLA